MLWSCSSKRFKACQNKKPTASKALLLTMAVMILLMYVGWKAVVIIRPSVESLAEIKAKEMVSVAINEATKKQFFKEATIAEELLIINTNNEGNIELVQSNTVAMNILAAELGREIKQMYRDMKPGELKVPVGTVLGSQLLSQSDFNLSLKVMPLSVASLEFFSEFESQGINQTKYKVYLLMTSKVRIMAPFSSNVLEIQSVVPVAEAVILGKVPNSYVNIPENGILDAMDVGE